MGWLQSVGLSIGNNILVGQKIEAQDVETQMNQQKLEMSKMASQQEQQKMATRKEIGDQLSTMQASEKSGPEGLQDSAALLDKASMSFAIKGDFDGAKQMSTLSQNKVTEADRLRKSQAELQQGKMETLSRAAQDWMSLSDANDPLAAVKQKEVGTLAVAAGINPLDMPPPNSPSFKNWAENLSMATFKGKERMEFIAKGDESQRNFDEKQLEFKAKLADTQAARAQTAAIQREGLEFRKAMASAAAGRAESKADSKEFTNDFNATEKLSKVAQTAAKPYLDDRKLSVNLQEALSLGTPVGDQKAREILTSFNSSLKARATTKVYADNKSFGGVAQRVEGLLSRAFTGKYSDEDRAQLSDLATQAQNRVIDPSITRIEKDGQDKAALYGFDPKFVTVSGDFNRRGPAKVGTVEVPKAPDAPNRQPEIALQPDSKPIKVQNGIEYYKVGNQIFSKPVAAAK